MPSSMSSVENIVLTYGQICSKLHERRLAEAIDLLRVMVGDTRKEFLNERLDGLLDTYKNILKHSFSGVPDPQRQQVYLYLVRSLLEFADELKEILLSNNTHLNTYRVKKEMMAQGQIERSEAQTIIGSLTFDRELTGVLRGLNLADSGVYASREEALVQVFNIIWLANKYTDTEMVLLESVCDSESLPWHDKALVVSALTLSLLRYFDTNKFLLLFRFIRKKELHVWERAMIGVFIGFLKYNDRYYLYPQLDKETQALKGFPDIEKHIEAILVQFTRSKETDRVRKKWEEDILPAMLKMRPKIEEKLDLNRIIEEDYSDPEGKNPDWETVFEDSPDLLNKLQEFTEMQMEGMDVFISAFSQLKGFPFFQQISNWFVPFYAENQSIAPYVNEASGEVDLFPLFEKLQGTYFMCNSDKYSFCFNVGLLPQEQKSMMMNLLNQEMKSINELEQAEELINSLAMTRSVYTQYLQDLYRFFKLHPWKKEFDDIFSMELDLYETSFIKQLLTGKHTIRNIAEFYFDKGFYPDALKIFNAILQDDTSNIELFEKIAYCFEKTGDFQQAYWYYQKADLIESDRLWIIKKLAMCSKMLNNWEEALSHYRQADDLSDDDLTIQASIGQCLIHLEQYQEALDVYFKLEVLSPDNRKIRRPLAWCSFLLGKFDTARDYLERLLVEDPDNKYDTMNLGHVMWCMNDPVQAFSLYAKSLREWKDYQAFVTSFYEDKKHLLNHQIDAFEIDLMLDYLNIEGTAS